MKKKSKNDDVITFPLPSHALQGGYIYIPTQYRKIFPSKSFKAEIQYQEQHHQFIVSIDSAGRLRIIQSPENLFSFNEWFKQCKIKPKYEVTINRISSSSKASKWQIIINPPELPHEDNLFNKIIPAPSSEILEVGAFVQEIGIANLLKGGELLNDIQTLAREAFDEVLDPNSPR